MNKINIIVLNGVTVIYLYFNILLYFSDKSFRILIHHGKYSTKFTPKITTHYTVVPRENDPRWQGIFFLYKLCNTYLYFIVCGLMI